MTPPEQDAADYRARVYAALEQKSDLDQLIGEGEALLNGLSAGTARDVIVEVALALLDRYERADSPADLKRSIALLREGVEMFPPGSRGSVPLLVNLGSSLLRSFERYTRMPDLEEAIDRLAAARGIEGDFTSRSPTIHSTLGSALFRRAEATGSISARDASIALLERAVAVAAPGSPGWTRRLLNLCNPLFLRAERGDQAAVDRIQRTVDLLLDHTTSASPLSREILLLSSRAHRLAFEWSHNPQDLHRALEDYRRLLSRTDLAASDTALARSNFGNALRDAYEVTRQSRFLEEAIEQFRAALELLIDRPAEAAKQRANLAKVLTRRFEATGNIADIRTAVRLHQGVVAAGSLGDRTLRAQSAANLGSVLIRLGQETDDVRAVHEGLAKLSEALSDVDPTEDPVFVLGVSANIGEHYIAAGEYHSAAFALQQGLAALDEADRLSTGSPSRHRLLRRGAHVVQLAALALVRTGRYEEAVLALERGRARAVADGLKLDLAGLDGLSTAGRTELADAYALTVRELRAAGYRVAGDVPEKAIAEVRALHQRLEALTRDVRAVAGFEDFARPIDFAAIRLAAAASAPLVYGCITEFGAALLIVLGDGLIEVIHLPELFHTTVEDHASRYLAALDRMRAEGSSAADEEGWVEALDELTRWMGDAFMTRLCAVLAKRNLARAALLLPGWLNLLPVTAARLSAGAGTATDVLAWSYGPSAAALASASAVAAICDARSALLVSDPAPTDEEPLAAAAAEVDSANAAFEQTTILTGGHATRNSVLQALPRHDVAHFACHGFGDAANPLESFLLLADDEHLTLSDILHSRVSRMRLCVLSACDTATVGSQAPDEYVSLPTGLVQAGAAAVIAAQWPVWDVAAAVLSIRFYALWPLVHADPALALRHAQLWLRDATQRDVHQLVTQFVPAESRVALLEGLIGVGPQIRPFRAAQDWAAFAFVGC